MNKSIIKYAVGRYYFPTLFRADLDKSFLEDIKKRPYIREGDYEYALGDFSGEDSNNMDFLRGTFGRIRKGKLAEIYDHENAEFKQSTLPETADTLLEFLIDHEHHLIFVEASSVIPPEVFAKKFKNIYYQFSQIADVEIDFIFKKEDVFKEINNWDQVNIVKFKKLRPSNPSSLPTFENIEKLLKETNSQSTKLEFSSITDKKTYEGLNEKSLLIEEGLSLSAQGYGDATILGTKEGKEVMVETKEFIEQVVVDFSEEDPLNSIVEKVKKITEVNKNGEN